MRPSMIAAAALVLAAATSCTDSEPDSEVDQARTAEESFTSTVLATSLERPWELLLGPDGRLWITERSAGRVISMDVADGTTTELLTIADVSATSPQDGLLGVALHPSMLTDAEEPYVYLSYTYDTGDDNDVQTEHLTTIVRYTFDADAQRLDDPVELLSGLPASIDHNSGRLVYGPDDKLYYTIGDQGNNQFDRYCEPIRAQQLPTADEVAAEDWTAYQGKVLRINPDGSVPDDNPTIDGVRSHVYSYGHRNAQGLVFHPDGRLYLSEHGPKSDDEINLVEPGGNYGWPYVAGFNDDQSYVYGDWSAAEGTACEDLSYDDYGIPDEVPQQSESQFTDPAFVPPVATYHTVPTDHDFTDDTCAMADFICWPTVAPSSLAVYTAGDGVPGWADSLLMPSLKDGIVYRLPLSGDGTEVGEPIALWDTVNRYRDVLVGADPTVFYVITDRTGLARGADGAPTSALTDRGAVLEFRYVEAD